MTAREIYEAVLIEVNKENAPQFTVEEFNYLINKAVLALVNEKYNFYSANQQLSDDLRVLLKQSIFNLENTSTYIGSTSGSANYGAVSLAINQPGTVKATAGSTLYIGSLGMPYKVLSSSSPAGAQTVVSLS